MDRKTVSLIFCASVFAFVCSYAQDASVASGGDATGAGGSSSYSIGQPVYTTHSAGNGSSSAGVQQPYEFFIGNSGIDDNHHLQLMYKVYPNPSTAYVVLATSGDQEIKNLHYQLYGVMGKRLAENQVTATETTIPMEQLPAGNYFLKITSSQQEIKTFKIIKN